MTLPATLALALAAPLRAPFQEAPAGAPPAPQRPARVLLVTLDTVRADVLGCYGGRADLTPRLDELAKKGTRFTRAIAPMPETIPSHASMFTGRYPFTHGVTNNFESLADEAVTLAELLAAAGVKSAGVFHVVPFGDEKLAQGFTTIGYDRTKLASNVGKGFLAWLDQQPKEAPFFGWLHYYVAHDPYEPTEEFARRFVRHDYSGPLDASERARGLLGKGNEPIPADFVLALRERYEAEVAFVDQRVGELVDALAARQLLDSTLLVIAADHGESFERREIGTHALVTRQSTLRVPLIVCGPGVEAKRSVDRIVPLVDLFPTLLAAFGLETPERCDGRSLWPLLRGDEEGWEDLAFASLPTMRVEVMEDRLPGRLVVFAQRFKLVARPAAGALADAPVELFDLDADPLEEHDVAADHPDVVKALRRRLEDWVAATRRDRLAPGPISDSARALLEQLGYGR